VAIFSAAELAAMRQKWEELSGPHGLTKAQLNAALQAIEDRFETSRNVLINDVNDATSPATTTADQKKFILGVWCASKARREGVLNG
jgi:hypothetical protein